MNIITNNVPRPLLYGYELSAEQLQEFDYLTEDELLSGVFIKYKNHLYDLNEVERIPSTLTSFKGWVGYVSEGFFSGVLFRFSECGEFVTCGRYYS